MTVKWEKVPGGLEKLVLDQADTEDDPSGEFVLCDMCGQTVLRGDAHRAQCGLPCEGGKVGLDDEVTHDQDCPRCL